MADYFADAYFGSKYWTANYFQGGLADPNAMAASLAGSGSVAANLTAATVVVAVQGGGWLSKEQLRAYEKTKRRKRLALDELETTVAHAYAVLNGGKTVPAKAVETPKATVTKARELARVLVARKATDTATNAELALLKALKRLADQVIADMKRQEQEEEEAMVMLLLAA